MANDEKLTMEIQKVMFDFVRSNDVFYIADLWHYAEHERNDDWFPVLCKRKVYRFFKTYLSERRSAMRRAKKAVPPPKNSIWDEIIISGTGKIH